MCRMSLAGCLLSKRLKFVALTILIMTIKRGPSPEFMDDFRESVKSLKPHIKLLTKTHVHFFFWAKCQQISLDSQTGHLTNDFNSWSEIRSFEGSEEENERRLQSTFCISVACVHFCVCVFLVAGPLKYFPHEDVFPLEQVWSEDS